jgi:hypothetical protein
MLDKILLVYEMSEKFCDSMEQYKADGLMWNDVKDTLQFRLAEERRERMMDEDQAAMVLGVMGYLAVHPKRMMAAQKFYGQEFGKYCFTK